MLSNNNGSGITGQVEAPRGGADGIKRLEDDSNKCLKIAEDVDETEENRFCLTLFRAARIPEDIRCEYLNLEQEADMARFHATASLTPTVEK